MNFLTINSASNPASNGIYIIIDSLNSVFNILVLNIGLQYRINAKRCKYHKAFNLCFNFKVKWTKILYLITFYIGLSITCFIFDNIILGLIILSTIPISYLRKSYVANLFACLGFIWTVFCCWHYYDLYTPPIQAGLGNVVAFELFFFFIPVTLIATAIFILAMIIELILKKSIFKNYDYGKWFLYIPEFFHLLCLYIGLIGGIFYLLYLYSFIFYIFSERFFEEFLRYI